MAANKSTKKPPVIPAKYTKLFEFEMLYSGWESDGKGWVCEEPDGKRFLLLTNHGTPYVAPLSELTEKLEEYKRASEETQKAINMLKA